MPASSRAQSPHSIAARTSLLCLLAMALLSGPADAATIIVGGDCTLVKAIHAANTDSSGGDCIAGSGGDTLVLTGDVVLSTVDNTNTGPNGLPLISTEITILGGNWTIERAGGTTDFRLFEITPAGNLTLSHVGVENGRITIVPGQLHGGGGILGRGNLTINNSTISGNQVVANGWWAVGGGIQMAGGNLAIASSTLALNSATSTTHGAVGGGLWSSGGSVYMVNSTISGNYVVSTVDVAFGGGADLSNVTTATLRNATFSGNAASGHVAGNGAALMARDTTTVSGSVFGHSLFSPNCIGTPELTDGDENLSDDGSCGTIPATLNGLDPVLRDNGGPTRTHALLDGSNAVLGAPTCGLATDQRGAFRGVFCDAGAFEYGGCPAIALYNDTILVAKVFEECQIRVGPNYAVFGPSGHLTLRVGREAELDNGFMVGFDAGLTIEIDSSLIP